MLAVVIHRRAELFPGLQTPQARREQQFTPPDTEQTQPEDPDNVKSVMRYHMVNYCTYPSSLIPVPWGSLSVGATARVAELPPEPF